MEQTQTTWGARTRSWPRKVVTGAMTQVKKRYQQLKKRYGPRYTKAMLLVVFIALFSPVPGTTFIGISVVLVIAEVHRRVSKRNGPARANPKECVMAVHCDVILEGSATPAQLSALGGALWRWCSRAAGDTGIYQCLDNQALADLVAGKLPASSPMLRQTGGWGVHFRVRDEISHDRRATIDSLRREIPANAVWDILVNGTSWNRVEPKDPRCVTF